MTDSYNFTIRKIVIATGEVTTIAGTAGAIGSADGTGAAARFGVPAGITIDGANLFVVDSSNHTIRKIVIATGVVTTIAGTAGVKGSSNGTGATARFNAPTGITSDGTNLFVVDTSNHTIRKIVIATGVVTTIAGTAGSDGKKDGTGTDARFFSPSGITKVGTNLFVTDTSNNTIRKIVIATGEVTTLAGKAGSYGNSNSNGAGGARFYHPRGITSDGTNLFVADYLNSTIRKIVIAGGNVTMIAGGARQAGYVDGKGSVARFNFPNGIAINGNSLFVTDSLNNTIRKVQLPASSSSSSSSSSVLASSNTSNSSVVSTNSSSNSTVASSNNSSSSVVASSSNSSSSQSLLGGAIQINALNLANIVTTFAGTAGAGSSNNGTGAAAGFNSPHGITTDGINLFVTDSTNNTIRKIE